MKKRSSKLLTMKFLFSMAMVLSLFLATASQAMAMTGKEIVDKVKEEYGDFNDMVGKMQIKTFDKKGLINDRQVMFFTKKEKDTDTTKSLLKFLSPSDVKGTALLDQGNDIMYMYLPDFHKTKRIAGSAKTGSFMGTDFTYNDLSLINYDTSDYVSKLIAEDSEAYYVELRDKDLKNSDYDHLVMSVRKSDFFPTEIKFYDKGKKECKVLNAYKVTQYGKHKFPKELKMVDLTSDHRTEIYLDQPEFDVGLKDSIFTERTMTRSNIKY
jgi:outer membrane lipoprotein-sorting protein